jgi:hypothetical protein
MQPSTLEVLRGLGITETPVERSNDAVQLRMHVGQRIMSMRLFDIGLEDTAFPFLLFISQAETEAILNEHLAARERRSSAPSNSSTSRLTVRKSPARYAAPTAARSTSRQAVPSGASYLTRQRAFEGLGASGPVGLRVRRSRLFASQRRRRLRQCPTRPKPLTDEVVRAADVVVGSDCYRSSEYRSPVAKDATDGTGNPRASVAGRLLM